jgi:hypothetical protein
MKRRCLNENDTVYSYYGGRGIRVCESWMEFDPFYEWAMTHGYEDGLSIERKDVNGDYEPKNCEWIPRCQQSNNTRKSLIITFNGKTQNLKQWSKELGIKYLVLYKRIIVRHWDIERAFR